MRVKKWSHDLYIYMRAHFMLQYLNYWIWISNVTSQKNLIYWKKKFNNACQYLDIVDEYLLFNIHFSPCGWISRSWSWISNFLRVRLKNIEAATVRRKVDIQDQYFFIQKYDIYLIYLAIVSRYLAVVSEILISTYCTIQILHMNT